ncbi:hypothetical protein DNH61_00745 [Paenibacillus sambharensis]|uniref:Uncharacterized protein n=1 Tax=Paenibacillus sambharensis TaxID=1803190 RepID=A0A2W1M1M7_9BACL|nr:hypothetical protein [Paenibacillus sambharensis]PZD97821.1 hypothetical protein DNH61_00745 [Paenibacillus sambharensis]
MKQKLIKNGIISATAIALLLQPGYMSTGFSYNSTQGVVSAAAAVSKSVRLNANSTLQIRDARLLMQDKGLVLSYTVTITNNGSRDLNLIDYWTRLKGKGGKSITATVSEADKERKLVPAKSSVSMTYFATVDNTTKLKDLSFEVVKWDFSAPNYERRLGTIKFPSDTSIKTAAYKPGIMLMSNTKVKGALKQYYVTQDQNSLYVTLSFLLENIGYSSVNLANVGFALQSDNYSVYDVNSASIAQSTLQPKERKIVTLTAKVPKALSGKSVTLVPYTKDEANKAKIPHGAFAIPAFKAAAATAVNKSRTIYMEGQRVKTAAENAVLNENDGKTDLSMEYVLENIGAEAVKLPALEFSLRTKNNVSYPLTYNKEEQVTLLPNIKKAIALSGTIPADVDKGSVELVVRTAAVEGQESYVLGIYKFGTSTQQGAVGTSFTYNKDYQITLSSVERTPQTDNDILVADLAIKNTSSTSKSTPAELSGYFLINGVRVTGDTTTAALDQTINIAPGSTYHMVVYTKIPYTTSVDNISFVLTEAPKEKPVKNLFQFTGQKVNAIKTIMPEQIYEINSVGNKASVKVRNTAIYEGTNVNYFYTEFEVVNLETRSAQLAALGAFLQDNQGRYVPLKISEIKERVMANGKVLVSVTGQLGKSFNTANYNLIFGQALSKSINAGTGAGTGQENTVTESILINPVSYRVINQVPSINSTLNEITFSAYTLGLKNMRANLNVSGMYQVDGVKLEFDYDLATDEQFDYVAGEHKIMIEFVDQEKAQATYSKTFDLLKASGDNQPFLKTGTDIPMEIAFNDPEIQNKVRDYKTYVINVYDVVENAKVLIASKEMKWFDRN